MLTIKIIATVFFAFWLLIFAGVFYKCYPPQGCHPTRGECRGMAAAILGEVICIDILMALWL